jgi:hypothetical protein
VQSCYTYRVTLRIGMVTAMDLVGLSAVVVPYASAAVAAYGAGGDQYTVTVTSSSGFQVGSHNTQTNVTGPPGE